MYTVKYSDYSNRWYVSYKGKQVTETYATKEIAEIACEHYNSGKYVTY